MIGSERRHLGVALRRVLDGQVRAPVAAERGHLGIRTTRPGPDPIRILLIGGGIAVGYGVHQRQHALEGPLARMLAERTGRGVIIDNRADRDARLADTRRRLGGAGSHTFHAVIWCPSFTETIGLRLLGRWRRELVELVDDLQRERPVPVLLTGLPVPLGTAPTARLERRLVRAVNLVVTRVAARPHVAAVEMSPFGAADAGPSARADYYEAAAMALLDRCLAALGVGMTAGVRPAA